MSENDDSKSDTAQLGADRIAAYLRQNPKFFTDYPELLAELSVPHTSGDAVSLVERQVSLLREQNEQARHRLRELVEIARHNEELARRMHHLVLKLMDSAEPKEIFATLYESLRENFNADRVAVRLFAEPAFVDSYAGDEFAGRDINELTLFKSIIERRWPLSGTLKRQQQVFLFGDDGDDIASAVMVPLHGVDWGGILAIGSRDAERFQENMGVDLLANLGEVLSYIVKPWIAEP